MHSLFSGRASTQQFGRRYPNYAHFPSSLGSSSHSAASGNNRSGQGPPQSHCGFGQARTAPANADPEAGAMSQVQSMKKQVVQLHQEAAIPRIAVSQACEELMKYCLEHEKQDVLVTGISPSDNPFKENKACVLL